MPRLNLRSSCTINGKISALKQWKDRFELLEHTSYLDNQENCRFSATSRSQETIRIFKLSWFKPHSEVGVVPLLAQSAGSSSYKQDKQTAGTRSGRTQVSLTCLEEQTYSACGFLFPSYYLSPVTASLLNSSSFFSSRATSNSFPHLSLLWMPKTFPALEFPCTLFIPTLLQLPHQFSINYFIHLKLSLFKEPATC